MQPDVGRLCAAFRGDAPPALASAVRADPAGSEAALQAALDSARATWPGLLVADEVFMRHLAPRLQGERLREALAQVQIADLYLACGCLTQDEGAMRTFDQHILSQVGAFLAARRPTPDLVDEVRQRLRERLLVAASQDSGLPKISEYSGRGSLSGWVRVIAVRVALNMHRNMDDKVSGRESPAIGDLMHGAMDPETAVLRARCGAAFQTAFQDALASLSKDQRALLQMHMVAGLNVDQIGAVLRLSRATAARRVVAAREEVARITRQLLKERLKLTTRELDSLTGLVMSQVDISIARCLRTGVDSV